MIVALIALAESKCEVRCSAQDRPRRGSATVRPTRETRPASARWIPRDSQAANRGLLADRQMGAAAAAARAPPGAATAQVADRASVVTKTAANGRTRRAVTRAPRRVRLRRGTWQFPRRR